MMRPLKDPTPAKGGMPSMSAVFILSILFLAGFVQEPSPAGTPQDPAHAGKSGPALNTAVKEFEPVLAVRGSGCITCHAEIHSNFITDFGFGDPYFFGAPGSAGNPGPFNGSIYGDFFGDEPDKTAWSTARMHKAVIVPKAGIGFDLNAAAGKGSAGQAKSNAALRADTLAKYLEALENGKDRPAAIVEKKKVFIGAPGPATIEDRFQIPRGSAINLKYLKTDEKTSPDLKGIGLSADGNFHTNDGDIVCDGDLFIRGILFLNKPSIATATGCRIYATGPVFLQDAVTYRGLDGNADRANLQIASAEAVFLGVGRKKCGANATGDPLSSRLLLTPSLPSIMTRTAARDGIPPKAFAQALYDKAATVPLQDSSCHDDTLGFSRILLDAPIVHSRYKGKFKGVAIAEFALFFQGRSSYEFDPVFAEVPILPVLKESDYLVVE